MPRASYEYKSKSALWLIKLGWGAVPAAVPRISGMPEDFQLSAGWALYFLDPATERAFLARMNSRRSHKRLCAVEVLVLLVTSVNFLLIRMHRRLADPGGAQVLAGFLGLWALTLGGLGLELHFFATGRALVSSETAALVLATGGGVLSLATNRFRAARWAGFTGYELFDEGRGDVGDSVTAMSMIAFPMAAQTILDIRVNRVWAIPAVLLLCYLGASVRPGDCPEGAGVAVTCSYIFAAILRRAVTYRPALEAGGNLPPGP